MPRPVRTASRYSASISGPSINGVSKWPSALAPAAATAVTATTVRGRLRCQSRAAQEAAASVIVGPTASGRGPPGALSSLPKRNMANSRTADMVSTVRMCSSA